MVFLYLRCPRFCTENSHSFFALSYGRILNLLCFLLFLKLTRLAGGNLFYVFQKIGLKLHFIASHLSNTAWSDFLSTLIASSAHTTTLCASTGFSTPASGSACRPCGETLNVRHCQKLVGTLPAEVMNSQQDCVPCNILEIICFSSPGHGSPAVVLWLLLERNEFL